jgi:hypothetical protein
MHANPILRICPQTVQKESYLLLRQSLNLDVIVNTSVFILPLWRLVQSGATYTKIKMNLVTEDGKQRIILND